MPVTSCYLHRELVNLEGVPINMGIKRRLENRLRFSMVNKLYQNKESLSKKFLFKFKSQIFKKENFLYNVIKKSNKKSTVTVRVL